MKRKGFSNDMLAQIREWIDADKVVIVKRKQLKEFSAKRRAVLEECRLAGESLFFKAAREMKNVDWRLSLADRKRGQLVAAEKHIKLLREAHVSMRRKARKIETQMELAATTLGKRIGHLRHHFEQRFVIIAQRERNRIERQQDFDASDPRQTSAGATSTNNQ